MRYFLYSINYSPELTGIGKYNGELISALSDLGVESCVLTSPPYYPEWCIGDGFLNFWTKEDLPGVTIFRSPLYIPAKLSFVKRIFHLFSFSFSSGICLLRCLKFKPDIVMVVQPTLFCAPLALIYSWLVGAKSIMHIQDFEVDAMLGLGMAKNGLLTKLVKYIESSILKRFDIVSSISYSMLERAKNKGVNPSRLLFFPNWADTDFVTPAVDGSSIRESWGYGMEDKIVLYSGNIGQKQGLEVVVEAAEFFGCRSGVKFIIIGSGANSDNLREMVARKGLKNIIFKSLQPWEDVPSILAMADVHLVVQKKGAADSVLPSKLTNILSAGGHALVTAEKDTELGKLASLYPGIYTRVEPEETESFIAGLDVCLTMNTKNPNVVAREYALNNLNKKVVIDRFVKELEGLAVR